MRNAAVLVIGSDPVAQGHIAHMLSDVGYQPLVTGSLDESLDALAENRFMFTVIDPNVPGTDPTDTLRRLRGQPGAGPVIALLAGNGGKRGDDAPLLGADEFLQLPCTAVELESAIKGALSRPGRHWASVPEGDSRARLLREMSLWQSSKMREVRDIITQAARVDVTVLVGGETGTGKDLVARAIHALSAREAGPFVKVNCAAVPRELLESELFGHERGAFTGAHQRKIGKFESADRGTIFLDEIGDLHSALQGKLLHVLQDGQFSRVGGRSNIKVDVRVLAATNQNLERAVRAGEFREDLYYRLNVIQIVVPPLRERPEDIPLLATYFFERFSRLFQRGHPAPPPEAIERLMTYRFPGNVRELENMVKRMIVLGSPLTASSLGLESATPDGPAGAPAKTAPLSLKDISRRAAHAAERQMILQALEQTRWNRVKAAKLLNISYRALLYKLKDAALQTERPSPSQR